MFWVLYNFLLEEIASKSSEIFFCVSVGWTKLMSSQYKANTDGKPKLTAERRMQGMGNVQKFKLWEISMKNSNLQKKIANNNN